MLAPALKALAQLLLPLVLMIAVMRVVVGTPLQLAMPVKLNINHSNLVDKIILNAARHACSRSSLSAVLGAHQATLGVDGTCHE